MKIEYQPKPFFDEISLDGQAFDFNAPLAAKKVTVQIRYHTKTRIDISFRYKSQSIGVNMIPIASNCYKFHFETEHSISVGNKSCAYFILSKKQGLPELEEHIKNCVKQVFQLCDKNDFTIIIWETKPICDLKEKTSPIETSIAS